MNARALRAMGFPRWALWPAAFATALAGHIGGAALILSRSPPPLEGAPLDAVAIDFVPEPPAETAEDTSGPPAAEAVASPDTVDQPEAPAQEAPPPQAAEETPVVAQVEPLIEPPPPVDAAVVIARQADPPTPKPEEAKKAEPRDTAASQARPAPAQAAAGGGRPSAARIATWKSEVALRLAHHRRYPPGAQAAGVSGIATVRFALAADGRVVSRALVKSSGSAALDAESLALVGRAQPYPKPPPNMPAPVEIVTPIQFSIR